MGKEIPVKDVKNLFFNQDMKQIKAMGLSKRDLEKQMEVFSRGPNYWRLIRPCMPGDGVLSVSSNQRKTLVGQFEAKAGKYRLLKFVPASGAASRMFAGWFAAASQGSFGSDKSDKTFFRHLKKMPFASLIEKDQTAGLDAKKEKLSDLLNFILTSDGHNFGNLPKALILFHCYPDGEIRTALEEHLVEAGAYLGDCRNTCRLHFTLSEEHVEKVMERMKNVQAKYEKMFQVRMDISYSIQSPATRMIAIDEQGFPLRDGEGRLVFRPGGHGALLRNLSALDADFVFVKNIDNIVRQDFLDKLLPYKKMLGGLAIQIRETVFSMLQNLESGQISDSVLSGYEDYCRQVFHMAFPAGDDRLSLPQQRKKLFILLNRPLRICAVVKNQGEPGGGPFWVEEKDGGRTLQIVEHAHVDPLDAEQQNIWKRAAYFNPVDMVCCLRNYQGDKFDLKKYVHRDVYLLSSKTEKGRKILCQELPGLWNGGMAYWNTVFVEMPLAVFNPVKTVDDLLRIRHAGGMVSR
ncbi:MAG: DUF4301 family protein [Syntrophaceae bacterium]|nr:DUF4301 family protein [Syntrophaceae bacterium]